MTVFERALKRYEKEEDMEEKITDRSLCISAITIFPNVNNRLKEREKKINEQRCEQQSRCK